MLGYEEGVSHPEMHFPESEFHFPRWEVAFPGADNYVSSCLFIASNALPPPFVIQRRAIPRRTIFKRPSARAAENKR
jgi:hypothetical protein